MPRTSTYLCIWEITYGHLKLDMSLTDARIMSLVGKSFGLGFTDLANAPAAEFMPPLDLDSRHFMILSCQRKLNFEKLPFTKSTLNRLK
jgi:hypothetical protein